MNAKVYNTTGSMSQRIREVLTANPTTSVKDIMAQLNCSDALVYAIRSELNLSTRRVKKSKKAKKASGQIRVPVFNASTVGKPDIAFADASRALRNFVNEVKGLSITFDAGSDRIELVWNDDLFQVSLHELPKAIDSIKYLSSKETNYSFDTSTIID